MTPARPAAGWRAAAFAALVALAPPALAWEAGSDGLKPIPPLAARVTDLASALTAPERAAVEQRLAAFESASGGQMAVLIVPSTQPEPIEAYAIRVADAWKIGRKGSDNGVLLVVAKDDRRMRLEVGYGYEGAIPDAVARRIIAEDVAPRFRENRYAAGIEAAIARVAGLVKGEAMPAPKASKGSRIGSFDPVLLIVILFVVVPAIGAVLKSVLGKVLGSAVGGGVVGAGAFVLGGSILLALVVALVAFVVILVMGAAGLASAGRRGNGGIVIPGGGWGGGGGFGGGGGGWSGGGGGFGGGGASGSW